MIVKATVSSQPEKLFDALERAGVSHEQGVLAQTTVRVDLDEPVDVATEPVGVVYFCNMPPNLSNVQMIPAMPGDGQPIPRTLRRATPVIHDMKVEKPGFYNVQMMFWANGAMNAMAVGEPELVREMTY